MITLRHISSTADFDFDRLYADSYADMAAGSYPWPDDMTDEAQRKQYFADWINGVLVDPYNWTASRLLARMLKPISPSSSTSLRFT